MKYLKLFILSFLVSNITSPYTSLGWSPCSTAAEVPQIKIERLSIRPMPIKHPGTEFFDIRAQTLNPIQGRIPAQFDIIRTVAGLALPVRCSYYMSGGSQFSVGSCSYADLCKDYMQGSWEINGSNCRPELADFGIDCNCPFNIPTQTEDVSFDFYIPDLSSSIVSFYANGDFNVKVVLNNAANQHIACFRFLYTITKA